MGPGGADAFRRIRLICCLILVEVLGAQVDGVVEQHLGQVVEVHVVAVGTLVDVRVVEVNLARVFLNAVTLSDAHVCVKNGKTENMVIKWMSRSNA